MKVEGWKWCLANNSIPCLHIKLKHKMKKRQLCYEGVSELKSKFSNINYRLPKVIPINTNPPLRRHLLLVTNVICHLEHSAFMILLSVKYNVIKPKLILIECTLIVGQPFRTRKTKNNFKNKYYFHRIPLSSLLTILGD